MPILSALRTLLKRPRSSFALSGELEEPIRAELFSVERLEQHAESLAAAQQVTSDPRKGRRIGPRVRENGRILLETYRAIADAIREERAITPAAEWLVDNFHIIEDQLREIREDLPPGYYRKLPKLAGGHLQGYPRVYGLAWAFVAHTDSRFDPEALRRFVRAYQRVQTFSIGELWAIAITLRIVLVENLRRLAERIVLSRTARQQADRVADRLLGLDGRPPDPPDVVLRSYEGSSLARAFAVQLVQRLRDQDPAVVPALQWLDERLQAQGTTADEIVRIEHQRQGAMNVTVRNIITSMRQMSAFDWTEFFERVSMVDELLRAETEFAAMDFPTRDRYRHAIEELSRGSGRSETEITLKAIERTRLAQAEADRSGQTAEPRLTDSGYYLISHGRIAFEEEIGFRPPLSRRMMRTCIALATPGYLGIIAIVTAIILSLPLYQGVDPRIGFSGYLLLALLALIPASDLAITLINRFALQMVGPKPLPKLELRDGVPPTLRTMVVLPTMLSNHGVVRELIERLEVHYLSNADGDVRFALLSDWTDAPQEQMPGDTELLQAAAVGIERLNLRHGPAPGGGERFLLLHRKRLWNSQEGVWMGWERKRGKLHELNRLLQGASDTTFLTVGNRAPKTPPGIRYIITLDSDTRLPRNTASRLVGTMAHPLNRPRFDERLGRVVEGYGLLQPRIVPELPREQEATLYHRIFSGPCGMDLYASAVSDVYQDLFDEGSYTGKGIYDLDTFEAALRDRVQENALLSHDLFEGLFARAGLATDIEFFEDFPSHYDLAASRQHRWARGDWQLLPWIFGASRRSISWIGRWKMLDNLRRSLSAPAMCLTLLAAWTLPYASSAIWTRFILGIIALQTLMHVLTGVVPRRAGIAKRSHIRRVATDFLIAMSQIALSITFLAHQAVLMCDAIARTLTRLFWTHRRMLEWVTAAQAKSRLRDSRGFYRGLAPWLLLPLATAILVLTINPQAWRDTIPFLLLWFAAPAVARRISVPPRIIGVEPITEESARILRLTARKTWRYFETTVGEDSHWLPPDNFQEDPQYTVAHRTSPTNIGLYLLSTVAARDLGWVGTADCLERIEKSVATMGVMERYRGHLYNWYETTDLRPLAPKYVSTVDSGNLAGNLIVLRNSCREMILQPFLSVRALSGLEDTLALVAEAEGLSEDVSRTQFVTRKHLNDEIEVISALLRDTPTTAPEWAARLLRLEFRVETLLDIVRTLSHERATGQGSDDALAWAEALRNSVTSHTRDLDLVAPWGRALAVEGRTELPEKVEQMLALVPSPLEAPAHCETALRELVLYRAQLASGNSTTSSTLAWLDSLMRSIEHAAATGRSLVHRLETLRRTPREMFDEMEFGFLFDHERKLFAIGYRVDEGSLDSGHYDLLASEARLASFLAIAKGEVPLSHWYRLGRALTPVGHGSALVSWSGSMFEYLMPLLLMRAPLSSVLEQTYRLVVQRQISYGAQRGIPWGISESAFYRRDLALTYQYSNFGVPGLGLKRGLSEDIVVAPYATALAAMVDPNAAARNFTRLRKAGALGPAGYYEALDYTPARLPEGQDVAIVRAYMAHHQGMSIVAIVNVLCDGIMRGRFHSEPIIQSAELLLQERTPSDVAVARPRAEEVKAAVDVRDAVPTVLRRFSSPHDPIPRTHILSNGNYAVMMTAAGSGYSRWRDLAVTRWREDVTRDCWGNYIFLRDAQTGDVWSAGYQPSGTEPDSYDVTFSEDRIAINRRGPNFSTTLTVVVSPEDDAEVRRVSITNLGSRAREVELTSYSEIVLAPPAADAAHPAFSNLFVQTEHIPEVSALLASRRPRAASDSRIWAAHVVIVDGESVGSLQFESDRARFLGRGRGIRSAVSVIDGRPLSNTAGSVLDPIFSLRRRLRIPAGGTARVVFTTLVAPTREAALDLADKYHDLAIFDRAATLAWTQAQVQLYHLRIDTDEAHLFQRVANRILYSDPSLRSSTDVLQRNVRGPASLWQHGISGDLPIVLVRIDEPGDREIVRQLLHAHEYWRMKRLNVDLVILNEQPTSYAQDLQASLEALARASQSASRHEEHEPHGKVFVLRGDVITAADRDVLQTAARAILLSRHGTLAEQVVRQHGPGSTPPQAPRRTPRVRSGSETPGEQPRLEFFNGLGGFTPDGREYVTVMGEGQWTPAPWINVIANETFGFQVSESGSGYTWSLNSRENQLTPWSNDPVSDPAGEAIYLRDLETGELWGPTALPVREESGTYLAGHGQGYSRFEHRSRGVRLELLQFVPLDDPVKISRLVIENNSGRSRRLSVTAYVEWVLGASRTASAPFVVTEIDPRTGALFARNAWNSEFAGRVAFADLGGRQESWSGDRTEFLGRNGTPDYPAALAQSDPLSGRVGAGLDPCGALQETVELRDGAQAEFVFLLGQAGSREEAQSLIERYRAEDIGQVLDAVVTSWNDIVGALQVQTPDRSLDVMLNRWLLYQTLSCRVWARSGFYQVSGAYGFRDQLQDALALLVAHRQTAREHLLRAASHQFVEGDVQHWWHPPSGRGVRTRISDDLLWLPYAVSYYVDVTGDRGILDETAPFLEGAQLGPDQHEAYFAPTVSETSASLYEHCARSLDRSLAVGSHGLPLMGSGDWNDGMNRVGHGGTGESVWLAWFLYGVLRDFSAIAEARGEHPRAEEWQRHLSVLKTAVERAGWDGDWYRRAYFDDGTPLGSASNTECRIDAIAQSWGVISGAADPARARRAMAAVEEYLVKRGDGIILLFTPPFDQTPLDPGYIKGYLPGVRENGGQYTHGAIWSVIAFAALGEGDKAGELFSLLNPINHASTRAGVHRYKVEPYVVAADIYGVAPHLGRGGWTWYTGSAGWMYRAGVEWILGFRLRGTKLHIDPCIPRAWRGFEISFAYHSSRYRIVVENPQGATRGVSCLHLDGVSLDKPEAGVELVNDGATHQVRVVLG